MDEYELVKWFDAVTRELPNAFQDVDLVQARREIRDLASIVTQPAKEPFSVRETFGGSGQSDAS